MDGDGSYPSNWDKIRKRVYRKDGYRCSKCGKGGGWKGDAELHAHHITPIAKGGTHDLSNLTTLCYSCHEAEHGHGIFSNKTAEKPWFPWGIQHAFSNSDPQPLKRTRFYTEEQDLTKSNKIVAGFGILLWVILAFTPTWIFLYHGSGLIVALMGQIIVLLILGIPLMQISLVLALFLTAPVIAIVQAWKRYDDEERSVFETSWEHDDRATVLILITITGCLGGFLLVYAGASADSWGQVILGFLLWISGAGAGLTFEVDYLNES